MDYYALLNKYKILNECLFCNESLKIFFEEFYPEDNKYFPNNEINYGKIKCPNCLSYDTNEYKDCFFCFNCKFKNSYKLIQEKYNLDFINGYLCRIKKGETKPEFFHRFIMKKEIEKYSKEYNIPIIQIEVHHIDGDKLNNNIGNLEIMDVWKHHEHHQNQYEWKAFNTWCYKKYGTVETEFFDEFIEWKEKKEDFN